MPRSYVEREYHNCSCGRVFNENDKHSCGDYLKHGTTCKLVRRLWDEAVQKQGKESNQKDSVYYKCPDCDGTDWRTPSCGKQECEDYAKWWKEKGKMLYYGEMGLPDGLFSTIDKPTDARALD